MNSFRTLITNVIQSHESTSTIIKLFFNLTQMIYHSKRSGSTHSKENDGTVLVFLIKVTGNSDWGRDLERRGNNKENDEQY